jgi:hypothetical protein
MGAPNSAACGPDHEGQRKKRRKSGEVVRAFACQLCTKRYGTRAALSLHFKLKHELPLRKTKKGLLFLFGPYRGRLVRTG